jgi:hypothetical protein
MAGLADFKVWLGAATGSGTFAGGLLASLLFTVFFCIVPCLIFTKGKGMVAEVIAGFLGLCFSVAVGWFDMWLFTLIGVITALLFAMKVKDMI